MALTNEERERVRYHLGYLSTAPAPSIQLGVPRATQALFLVESAMNNLLPEAEPRVRQVLSILDGIEAKLVESQERLAATKVGEIELNGSEGELLDREYSRWRSRLARHLGVYVNPYESPSASRTSIKVV